MAAKEAVGTVITSIVETGLFVKTQLPVIVRMVRESRRQVPEVNTLELDASRNAYARDLVMYSEEH